MLLLSALLLASPLEFSLVWTETLAGQNTAETFTVSDRTLIYAKGSALSRRITLKDPAAIVKALPAVKTSAQVKLPVAKSPGHPLSIIFTTSPGKADSKVLSIDGESGPHPQLKSISALHEALLKEVAAAPPEKSAPKSVGVATRKADGSIWLQLRSDEGAEALKIVKPTDKDFEYHLKHLGGLAIGESKAIPPYPAD